MTNPIPVQDSHEAPATFTVRPLTSADMMSQDELRLVAGGRTDHKGWVMLESMSSPIYR